ncbi:hypothetical protein E3N88_28277 [Mikania micrantha]|uniref:Uncharacterized protein n=1 Tax=Mikania micrantha TaxID=192012 RepID=A0A5N6N017_9ASTR|nr:hypothetical protein E3N88_28277 [Mikania micrantha]
MGAHVSQGRSESADQLTDGDGGGKKNQKKRTGYGRKAKRVVLSRIKPVKKNRASIAGGCCVCVKRISTLDSCTESPTDDPNSSEFTFDSLRSLIESSDFYLNECNTHFDLNR